MATSSVNKFAGEVTRFASAKDRDSKKVRIHIWHISYKHKSRKSEISMHNIQLEKKYFFCLFENYVYIFFSFFAQFRKR